MSATSAQANTARCCESVGVDIGGTFTDIIVMEADGVLHRSKVLSSPPDFGRAVIAGLSELSDSSGVDLGTASRVVHGTTVATNAILEGAGARTALVTTKGFRDVLEIGRMRRPALYDLFWQKPPPLVPRRFRFELEQRIAPSGEIELHASAAELETLAATLRAGGVESVAVCLLNSYRNPEEERLIAAELAALLDGLYVSASVDILPEIKEYERSSTTVVNAYVRPVMDRYVEELDAGLKRLGLSAPLLIMQSAGGLIDAGAARRYPVQLIESGPAAGVIAAKALMSRLQLADAITFDMGGTTAKASVLEGGEPFEAPEYEVGAGMNTRHGLTKGGGYAIRAPSIDISEVGAGGGSVMWIDQGGAPRIGPRSAGASPGPACYGAGGVEPTLTDALVLLGYLNPVALAGGTRPIDPDRAEAAIRSRSRDLGLDPLDTAYGAYRIAITNMSKAVKAVTSERGRDPRAFALIAFGGAGPAYAAEMAREFRIERVIVPPNAGLFSTVGLLVADIQHHDVVSNPRRDELDPDSLTAAYEEMEGRMREALRSAGHEIERFVLDRSADVRYVGQSSELRVPVPSSRLRREHLGELRSKFDAEHERTYGHSGADQRVEIVNLRLRASCPQSRPERERVFALPERARFEPPARGVGAASRDAYFGPKSASLSTPVLARHDVPAEPTEGPLIVEDMDATTVVPPAARCRRDPLGNLVIELSYA